jgi:hypothetical protein
MAALALQVARPRTDCFIHTPIERYLIAGRVTAKQHRLHTLTQTPPQAFPQTLPRISAGGNGVFLHILIHARLIGSRKKN